MPINPNFQKIRKKVGKEKNVTICVPLDSPSKLGIRGTYVAVDWDLCAACGICIESFPAHVYEWQKTANHPASEKKPLPIKAAKRICCYQYEKLFPVQSIRVIFGGPQSPLDRLASYLVLAQLIGGPLYGLIFGPYLHLTIPFYLGWLLFAASLLFFFSPVLYFKNRGKPADGKGVMDTTVIVESGTHGIVRHPQFLGALLMACACILISQHWLFFLVGIFVVGITPKWIREADENLVAKFGDEYERYMGKVPRINLITGIIRFLLRRRKKG